MWEGLLVGLIIVGLTIIFYLHRITKTVESANEKLKEVKLKPSICSHLWEITTEKIIENNDEKKLVLIQRCTMCGQLDKTVESLKKDKPRSECRHKWSKQKSANIDSAYEQYACESKNNKNIPNFNAWLNNNLGPWAFRKTHVCTYVCELCGEINTIIASNYDLDDVPETNGN